MGKRETGKRGRWKFWLVLVLTLFVSVVLGLYILWRKDVWPVEGDYTAADLRQAAPGSEGSYELLLSLRDSNNRKAAVSANAMAKTLMELNQIIQKHAGSPEGILGELKARKQQPEEIVGEAYPVLGLTAEDDKAIRLCYDDDRVYPIVAEKLMELVEEIELAWEHTLQVRELIRKLNDFPEIADETRPDFFHPISTNRLFTNLRRLASLYWLKVNLECERGNYEEAIDCLVEFANVPRKVLPNCRDMYFKTCCFSLLHGSLFCANYLVNLEGVSEKQVRELLQRTPALTTEQIGMGNCMIFDYLCFKEVVTDEQKVLQVLTKTKETKIPAGYLKVNSILHLYQKYLWGESYEETVWPWIYPDSWEVFDESGNKFTKQYFYYNPYGADLFAQYMQDTGRFGLAQEIIKSRDEAFHLIGRKRLLPEFDLRGALEEKKFTVDLGAGEIYRKEYWDEEEMFEMFNVAFAINAEVLKIK